MQTAPPVAPICRNLDIAMTALWRSARQRFTVKAMTRASLCTTMAEIRKEIDRIDRSLVQLLAERQTYIERAGHIKAERSAIRDPARVEDVIRKVVEEARHAGLDPRVAEPVWRELVERFIAHELEVFDAQARR